MSTLIAGPMLPPLHGDAGHPESEALRLPACARTKVLTASRNSSDLSILGSAISKACLYRASSIVTVVRIKSLGIIYLIPHNFDIASHYFQPFFFFFNRLFILSVFRGVGFALMIWRIRSSNGRFFSS